jgi:internalin A
LSPVGQLKGLRSLNLESCRKIRDLMPLSSLSQITWLDLTDTSVTDLGPLRGLSQLRSLDLSHNLDVSNLTTLAALHQLTSVSLVLNDANLVNGMHCLGGLVGLRKLKLVFNVDNVDEDIDLTPLKALSELSNLEISGSAKVCDIAPLAHLSKLTALKLEDCNCDLGPLAELTRIESLSLIDCKMISDLEPLRELTQLRWPRKAGTSQPGRRTSGTGCHPY